MKDNKEYVSWVDGETTHYYGFGNKIGQAELASTQMKSLKGDYYVLSSGVHILQILSAVRLPSAFLSVTSSA